MSVISIYIYDEIDRPAAVPADAFGVDLQPGAAAAAVLRLQREVDGEALFHRFNVFRIGGAVLFTVKIREAAGEKIFPAAKKFPKTGVGVNQSETLIFNTNLSDKTGKVVIGDGLLLLCLDNIRYIGKDGVYYRKAVSYLVGEGPNDTDPRYGTSFLRHLADALITWAVLRKRAEHRLRDLLQRGGSRCEVLIHMVVKQLHIFLSRVFFSKKKSFAQIAVKCSSSLCLLTPTCSAPIRALYSSKVPLRSCRPFSPVLSSL